MWVDEFEWGEGEDEIEIEIEIEGEGEDGVKRGRGAMGRVMHLIFGP